jgi:coproporphyrinogen III oxidase-like Fe-S oxidoreductase
MSTAIEGYRAATRTASLLSRLFEQSARVFLDRLAASPASPPAAAEALRGLRGPVGLYVHIPFCHTPLCRFCCFVRQPYREEDARLYRRAVLAEIENQASLAEDAALTSIYVGGGTPSIDPPLLAEILDHALESWGASRSSVVVSVEANPRDVDDDFISMLRGRVDRPSLGAQATTPERLQRLGRLNSTPGDLARALEASLGRIHTVNIDIVWGLPGEDPEETRREAARALGLGADQVTFYPIMPTPATRRWLEANAAGPWSPSEPESYAAILDEARRSGYRPSTPWCMSRSDTAPVDEYIVDTPWFIAAGPSGISRLPGYVSVNRLNTRLYADRVARAGLGTGYAIAPTPLEDALYTAQTMLFGLRWRTGTLAQAYGRQGAALEAYIEASLRLLGETPEPHGTWRLENPATLYALHRSQHSLYTALAWFRHHLLAEETRQAAAPPLPAHTR